MVLTAAILAGGRSHRMGTDKAFCEVHGIPFVTRTASVLSEAGVRQIYVVGRQNELASFGFPTIVDTDSGHHPLFGVASVLDSLPDDLVLFVPCDLVNLASNHIRVLLDYGAPCAASCRGTPHPLLSILPKSMAQTARELGMADMPARHLIRDLPIVALPKPDLVDANHPEQVPR